MTCNHCHPLCQCGAEEVAGQRLLDEWEAGRFRVEPWPRFPELESIEEALLNYAGSIK